MQRESFMKKTILRFLFTFVLFLTSGILFSMELTTRLYNRSVYTPESEILLHITLRNNESSPFRFHAADKRLFNLDFEVRNLQNLELEHSEYFKIERNSSQRVFYREIIILPGESYSFVADLKDYINIDIPGVYTSQTMFYSNLEHDNAAPPLRSNTLTFQIQPDLSKISAYENKIDMETGEILQREQLAPDEAVSYMLRARQKSQWAKFFLYLDVEQLMLQDSRLRMEYREKSDQERYQMVEQYREALQERQVDSDIMLVPNEFSIMHTSYDPQEAEVEVIQSFSYRDYTEKRKYTYLLRREDGYWTIYDYYVMNLGTE